MTVRLAVMAAALSLLAGGCMVGPDYRAPEIALPSGWTETHPDRGGMTADETWWAAFGDPILTRLVEEATSANLDVAQALGRVAEARANLGAARAGLFPALDGSAQWSRSRGVAGSQSGTTTASAASSTSATATDGGLAITNAFNAGLDASWELDLWGKVRRSVEGYGADLEAADADLRAVRLTVLGDVAKYYIDLRTTQARRRVAENAAAGYRDTLALTRARNDGGLVGATDVLKAEASLASAEAQLPALRSSLVAARHRLAVLTARPPAKLDRILSPRQPLPLFRGKVAAGVPADLLRRRPDIVKAERNLAAASARIGVAEAKLLPAVALSGSVGASETRTGGVIIGPAGTWSFGPSVSLPVFDAGKRRAEADAATARADQAAAAYRSAVLSALEEAEDAFATWREDRKKRDALSGAVKNYADALRLSKDLYARGLNSFLDVLETQRSLYTNQDALASTEGQVVTDLVSIFKVLGGGW
jgi:multidrug efflux system outer membrane protein